MSTLSKAAILEIHDLTSYARRLASGTGSERKQADVIMSRVANIRACGLSSDEMRTQYTDALCERVGASAAQRRLQHEAVFRQYMRATTPQHCSAIIREVEERDAGDMAAGTQTISYTEGPAGGMLVPFRFFDQVVTAMAQTDPLLDKNRVTMIAEPGYSMQPKTVPGYDLTQIAATLVGENTDAGVDGFPSSSSEVLQGYAFKLATRASFEIDQDDFEGAMATISRAHGVGLARGIGSYLVKGTGVGQPSGLLTGASNSGYTTQQADKITYTDIVEIYFSVNRIYRMAPKCAWVMADETFQLVRSAVDNNGRPLISVENDVETLMGQPVLVSPSMPWGGGSKGIVFGDLSHFLVRVSSLYFRKSWQSQSAIESGRALHMSRMRADSVVFDPAILGSPVDTSGAPLQYATLHA